MSFRKRFPLHADGFVFYATSPEQKIVAVAEKSHVILGDLEYIWERCEDGAGIGREEFERYYRGKTHGTAVGLTEVKKMLSPIGLSRLGIKTPPQSFMYLSDVQWEQVCRMVCRVEWR